MNPTTCPHSVPLADWCEWCSFERRFHSFDAWRQRFTYQQSGAPPTPPPPLVKGGQGRTAHELVSTSTSMLKLAFWLFVLALAFSVIARFIA